MKIILSRKGFNSERGGIPSTILPDGTICSLPIPSDEWPPFSKLNLNDWNLGDIVERLTDGEYSGCDGVHLDPDIRKSVIKRKAGWKPSFGQVGAAQSHLEHEGVKEGDLFLFYGWFRKTIKENGNLSFDPTAPNIHMIFGWLQIGKIIKPTKKRNDIPSWSRQRQHPHIKGALWRPANNTLYIASDALRVNGKSLGVPGGGTFCQFTSELVLTKSGASRTIWQLPSWFYPSGNKPPLSYHKDKTRWQRDKKSVMLKTVARGQEFVLDVDYYPDCYLWLRKLFKSYN